MSWVQMGTQMEEGSRGETVNMLVKRGKVVSVGRGSGKNGEERRARFGARREELREHLWCVSVKAPVM